MDYHLDEENPPRVDQGGLNNHTHAGGNIAAGHGDVQPSVSDAGQNTVNRLPAARVYWHRKWAVLPLPARSKIPPAGWHTLRFTEAELPRVFGGNGNIGFRPGSDSAEVVDVDLDCYQSIALADIYLPPTGAVFGRASKPRSHRLYVARGAVYEKFSDPFQQANCMLELRADTSAGGRVQTVLPPSVHTSGELITWDSSSIEPAEVDAAVLRACCAWLASACLIARYAERGWDAARNPTRDMPRHVWNRVPALGGPIYRWLGKFDPDSLLSRPVGAPIPDDADIGEVVKRIPNNLDRDGWVKAGMAIFTASGGSAEGYAAFLEFSRRSPRHHRVRTVERVWRSFVKSPPRRVGAGTLFWLARQGSREAAI